ncbi:MAG TPA: TlpA disulfide reductase family protein [Pseudobdellovibrionaceae bacterium]|jgi:thiol-disulfide isomerase/thioredoxin
MNKHLKALLIVGSITALILVAVELYKQKTQDNADSIAGPAKGLVQINQELPNFETKTLQGLNIHLAQFKGKVVVINFWASWCGPCIEEVPSLIKLMQAFPRDLELIAISGDSNHDDINSFMKSFPEMNTLSNIHVVWDADKKLSQKYHIYRLPESFLLNKDLKLVKKLSGTIDWHTEEAIAYVKQLILSKQNAISLDSHGAVDTPSETPSEAH